MLPGLMFHDRVSPDILYLILPSYQVLLETQQKRFLQNGLIDRNVMQLNFVVFGSFLNIYG